MQDIIVVGHSYGNNVSLHMIQIISFRPSAPALAKPSWFPEPLKMETLFIGMSLIVGVCAWQLAWTEIGFHPMPMAPVAIKIGLLYT